MVHYGVGNSPCTPNTPGVIHVGQVNSAQDESETDGLQIAVPSFWIYERKVGHADSAKYVVISDVSGVCCCKRVWLAAGVWLGLGRC